MAEVGYQAERYKIEDAQLRSWRSRQGFSKANHDMPRANIDPAIAALPTGEVPEATRWRGKQPPGLYCPGCLTRNRVREWRRRATRGAISGVGSLNVSGESNTGKHLRSR